MASKRMFSRRLVESARFLQMPLSTQALYFHLGLNADDDGVVEAYNVMQIIGCAQDDLKVLASKGYVKVLNEDLVTYITDWRENNTIRADRKTDSLYQGLLVSMFPDIDLLEKKQRSDVAPKIIDATISSVSIEEKHNGQSMDGIDKSRLNQIRLNQIRLEKDMIADKSENQSDQTITFSKDVMELFINTCPDFSKPRKLSQSRIDAIRQLELEYTLNDFQEAFQNMESSEYLRSNNYYDFDWAIKEDNFINLLENKYRKYKTSGTKKQNQFNNFSQRDKTDFDALEKKMTGGV